ARSSWRRSGGLRGSVGPEVLHTARPENRLGNPPLRPIPGSAGTFRSPRQYRNGMSLSSPARRARGLALGVLGLALASNFARTLHWLAVPHHLCEVHQRWEHGWTVDASATGAQHGARPDEGPSYRNTGRAHEDCPLDACARIEPVLDQARVLVRGALQE